MRYFWKKLEKNIIDLVRTSLGGATTPLNTRFKINLDRDMLEMFYFLEKLQKR